MAASPKPQRKLPVNQFVILAICRFAEPITLTSVFPYLPEMIESFGVEKDDIAFWAGLASAIYSFFQCVTAIPWGRFSDRIGRKPVILICLLNTMVTSLLWGFSTSLPMALAARALLGAGNGNAGIIRTTVAEMCPWKELQPRAFSIMPLIASSGSVIGPAIGGALSNPYNRLPNQPAGPQLFSRFPYAAPNLLSAAFFLVGLTTGALFLKETLSTKRHSRDWGIVLGNKVQNGFRRTWLRARHVLARKDEPEREPLLKPGNGVGEGMADDEESGQTKSPTESLPPPAFSEVLNKQTILNLIAYTMIAMQSIGYDQLIPVFLHHPKQNLDSPDVELPFKFRSGFSAKRSEIGMLFTMYGLCNIVFQLAVYPPVAQRFGVLKCFKVVVVVYPLIFALTPFSVLLPGFSKIAALFFLWLCKGLAGSFAFPSSTILLTNSASSLRILGTLNGIATSMSAVGRALGPTIGGNCFTIGVKHGYVIFPFWALGFVAAISAIPVFFLVEGEGFDGDESPADDIDEEELQDEEEENLSSGANIAGSQLPDNPDSRLQSDFHDFAALVPPGGLFRTFSACSAGSSSAAESVDGDLEDHLTRAGGLARLPRRLTAPSASEAQPSSQDSRYSRSGSHRRIRRKSSTAIGLGSGFRRMSSNLGQTMSGFGTGNGVAG